jgi:hypothetical protein
MRGGSIGPSASAASGRAPVPIPGDDELRSTVRVRFVRLSPGRTAASGALRAATAVFLASELVSDARRVAETMVRAACGGGGGLGFAAGGV